MIFFYNILTIKNLTLFTKRDTINTRLLTVFHQKSAFLSRADIIKPTEKEKNVVFQEKLFQLPLNKRRILEIGLKKYLVLNVLFKCGSSGSNIGEGWKKYLQRQQSIYMIVLVALFVLSSPLPASNSSGTTKE